MAAPRVTIADQLGDYDKCLDVSEFIETTLGIFPIVISNYKECVRRLDVLALSVVISPEILRVSLVWRQAMRMRAVCIWQQNSREE